jgi:hypothetical protein
MIDESDVRTTGIGGTRSPDDIRTTTEDVRNIGYHTAFEQRKQDAADAAQMAFGD